MAKSIVVVGGSLAGLMQGIRLKREGANVTILEQQTNHASQEAGVGFGRNVEEFLRRYDATGRKASVPAITRHFAYRTRPNFLVTKGGLKLSNWMLLYRILRANFDHVSSAACPDPPQPRDEDGDAVYLAGKRVTGLTYSSSSSKVTVFFEDVISGKQETIDADLVIGADGVRSTVRELVNAPTLKQYAGYVSWRGCVPEKLVSPETARYFENRLAFDVMSRTYIVCYVIPTEDGSMELGERLLNWVWYYNVAENSPEIREFFTDIHGNHHRNTVPRGLVQPGVWERVRKSKLAQMASPFTELLAKTEHPFITKINDTLCTTPSYYDGRVVLVGDAMTTFRPHMGVATEQAALHCLSMDKVASGEKTQHAHVHEIGIYAKSMWLLNRLVGEFGQGSTISFLGAVFRYIAFLVRIKLGRARL